MPLGRKQRCSLETLVLVSRRLEDMKNGLSLGLGLEVQGLGLGLDQKGLVWSYGLEKFLKSWSWSWSWS